MLNKVFGKLTVVSQYKELKQWICACSCGNETKVKECNLLNKHTSSCGCGRSETPLKHMLKKAIQANRKLSIGDLFHRLTVETIYPTRCVCACGNTIFIKRTASLFNGDIKSCGCLNIENVKKRNNQRVKEYRLSKGLDANNPMSTDNDIDRRKFHTEYRPVVFERDSYTCQYCSEKGGILNVHHIVRWSDSVELRFNMDNLITLCKSCHINIAHNGNCHASC